MKKVNVGFIGTGHFTAGNHLPNCRDNPNVHIRALCRRNMTLLKDQAKEYNPDYVTTVSGGKGSVSYPKELMEVFCDATTNNIIPEINQFRLN